MSELQISLVIIGLFIIVAVVIFNRWQEKKHRKLSRSDYKPPHGSGVREAASPLAVRQEPSFSAAVERTASTPSPLPPLNHHEIDTKINYVVTMELAEPISHEVIKGALAISGFSKPILWQGYNEDFLQWEPIFYAGSYNKIALGIRLADPFGALSETELDEFCRLTERLAGEWMAVVEMPDRIEALQRAKELDEFCMLVDVSVGVNVIPSSGGGFAVAEVEAWARAEGMEKAGAGVFNALDENNIIAYSLNISPPEHDAETAHVVTFVFDVPKVAEGLDVFTHMLGRANALAKSLSGAIVDDNRRPLSEAGIDKIRQQIAEIYIKMEEQDILPGSMRAVSLFS